jgi:SAM-dependent methyltransferase
VVSLNSPAAAIDHTASTIFLAIGSEFVKGRVLDVGCKNKPLKRLFPECEWVGLDKRPVGEIQADAHFMEGVEDNSFDTVVCINLLHKVESPTMVMKQIARVLKPGGFAVILTPNTYMDDHKSLFLITGRGMDYLIAAAGLEGVKIVTDGKTFSREWREEFNGVPEGVTGWTAKMDERYPAITFAVAHKPEEGKE